MDRNEGAYVIHRVTFKHHFRLLTVASSFFSIRPAGAIILLAGFFIASVSLGLPPETASGLKPDPGRSIADKIDDVFLYCVENGAVKRLALTGNALKGSSGIRVKGYVCGIEISCDDDVTASVNGDPLIRNRPNKGETVSLDHLGDEPARKARTRQLFQSSHERRTDNSNRYLLFPRAEGDALVYNDDFVLLLQSERQQLTIPVSQTGYRLLGTLNADDPGKKITFNYLGRNEQEFQKRSNDFPDRLRAVEKGIRDVETVFQMKLIDTVNIVEYDQGYGGMTTEDDGKTMWLYARSFYDAPLSEMTHMAAHETLHRYVTVKGWTKRRQIRELFGDLKGYDALSRERFMLITRGMTPPDWSAGRENRLFFAFIDERNFLEGAWGGHSHSDLDEFCVTFFHSMMFVDRLSGNLSHPIYVAGRQKEEKKHLTQAESARTLDLYSRTIQCFLDAIPASAGQQNAPDPARHLLEAGLKTVRSLQAGRYGNESMISRAN